MPQPLHGDAWVAAPEVQRAEHAGHPGHEDLTSGLVNELAYGGHQPQRGVDLTGRAQHHGQHAAAGPYPVIVAERFCQLNSLLGEGTGQTEVPGAQRADRLETRHSRGDAAIAAADEADGGGLQEVLGVAVAVTAVQDYPL